MTDPDSSFSERFGHEGPEAEITIREDILEAPLRLRRRGVEVRLVAGTADAPPVPDPVLARTLVRAHRWLAALRAGTALAVLAAREGRTESYLRTRLPLAFLSPRLQAALLAGTQSPDLSLERIVREGVPLDWNEQEQRFGGVTS